MAEAVHLRPVGRHVLRESVFGEWVFVEQHSPELWVAELGGALSKRKIADGAVARVGDERVERTLEPVEHASWAHCDLWCHRRASCGGVDGCCQSTAERGRVGGGLRQRVRRGAAHLVESVEPWLIATLTLVVRDVLEQCVT
jgi:hypothetical protein